MPLLSSDCFLAFAFATAFTPGGQENGKADPRSAGANAAIHSSGKTTDAGTRVIKYETSCNRTGRSPLNLNKPPAIALRRRAALALRRARCRRIGDVVGFR